MAKRTTNNTTRSAKALRHALIVVIATICIVTAVIVGVVRLSARWLAGLSSSTVTQDTSSYCMAKQTDGVMSYALSAEQSANAALITAIGVTRGLPDHAATVALATAMQESKLRNLEYGDRDSLGLFQQRPSQGWGTVEQLMDENYATNAFYDGLVKVSGWESLPVEDAAQEVQHSGYPDAYAQWDGLARAWAQSLTGEVAAGVGCKLPDADASDPDGLIAALQSAYPSVSGSRADGNKGDSPVTAVFTMPADLSGDNLRRAVWQTSTWLVVNARHYGITKIEANGMVWTRADTAWTGTEKEGDVVTVTFA
ncbi:cobalt transporter [Bifidobacterium platyrrhinorum]|uniref:Cobalt transporter n=1 Tax=Bifidobacterium platyrrhinorum TaxID=2661628 RepID=A0A6L9SU41_9BIFI|nr:cobalt transporter [Bifidobacterium platyrrhinorum]NEG54641.1 cobalt transporter [Bifidobacterium platyrrhinorum]